MRRAACSGLATRSVGATLPRRAWERARAGLPRFPPNWLPRFPPNWLPRSPPTGSHALRGSLFGTLGVPATDTADPAMRRGACSALATRSVGATLPRRAWERASAGLPRFPPTRSHASPNWLPRFPPTGSHAPPQLAPTLPPNWLPRSAWEPLRDAPRPCHQRRGSRHAPSRLLRPRDAERRGDTPTQSVGASSRWLPRFPPNWLPRSPPTGSHALRGSLFGTLRVPATDTADPAMRRAACSGLATRSVGATLPRRA
ncbi:hypothetical protein BDD21_2675 [Thiocapsa rosea]|uniref:Uncharacterized protein n=1 Tax=Thiocapsa rosea TaxID=69360 RepID=A0A495V9V7_9GAMM|nr:hypothetical protein BDD21_2675 [Thiocapsa rosea]